MKQRQDESYDKDADIIPYIHFIPKVETYRKRMLEEQQGQSLESTELTTWPIQIKQVE